MIALALVALALGGCHSSRRRESFEIVGYRFTGGKVAVESQRPGDPGCFVSPRLDATARHDGLHLRVTYVRTSQKFCIVPCPIELLTQTVQVPSGVAGRPVVLDHPKNKACSGTPSGGPAVVPMT